MTGEAKGHRALRQALRGIPRDGRPAWLVDRLRLTEAPQTPGILPARWRLAQSLILHDPTALAAACTRLLDDAATRPAALETLCRLHTRQEAYDTLRAVLLRCLDDPPEGAAARRLRLLRAELLAPSATEASRTAHWQIGAAALGPLGAASYAFQRAPEGKVPAALTEALRRRRDAALAMPLPPALVALARAGSVAVVGNGASVTGRGAGPAIDAHDLVVRINYPVLTGFGADVGRRTDLILFAEAKRATLPALLAREPEYPSLPALAVRVTWPQGGSGAEMGVVPRLLADSVCDIAYGRPTTGFFAILLIAVLLGRKVTLFGFDFFAPGLPGHYFGDATAAMPHEIAYERWFAARILPRLAPTIHRA